LDKSENGVFTSDSVEFSKDGFSIAFGLDGAQLGSNDVEGFDDLGCGVLSGFKVSMILGSCVSQDLFLFVEDIELNSFVFDFSF